MTGQCPTPALWRLLQVKLFGNDDCGSARIESGRITVDNRPYVLRSDRLGFREYREGDLLQLAEMFGDSYARRFYPEHGSDDRLQGWIAWNQRNYASHGFGLWVIEFLGSGRFVGDAGLTFQEVEASSLLEIGYHVHPKFRCQGFATEAALACLRWAFESTTHDLVCSIVHPENVASIRVAEKTHRLRRPIQGKSGPSLLFYTTRQAWNSERQPETRVE